MKTLCILSAVFVLAFVFANTKEAYSAEKTCTAAEATAAERAPANSWHSLHEQFSLYANCDDGEIAEGFSEAVSLLLADHWDDIGDLEKEMQSTYQFYKFVLHHIDMTVPANRLVLIAHNAEEKCPENLEELCHDIAESTTLTTPPYFPENIFEHTPNTVGSRLALKFKMGDFVVSFEKTPLKTVQKVAKSGSIQYMGDAGESVSWLCYSLASKNQPQRLWLTSGELDGQGEISGLDIASTDSDKK